MSNSLAIAAVTATLRNLILRGIAGELNGGDVFTGPPEKTPANDKNYVNLFLYHIRPSATWRNMEMPVQLKTNASSKPPLALDLYYLITAYGAKKSSANDSDIQSHRLLGRTMSVLHDHPVLSPAEIQAATKEDLADSDLQAQVECVRITLQSMSFNEMAELWRPLETQYRISAAYQVSVVLIESVLPAKVALPVLSRGIEDRGIAIVTSPSPSLQEVLLPNGKPSAELGDTVTIRGEGLDSEKLTVRFRSLRQGELIEIPPLAGGTAGQVLVKLPDAADNDAIGKWAAGFYTVSVVIQRPNLAAWTSNELPFVLAPRVINVELQEVPPSDVTLTLTCTPPVRSQQRVSLLFGDREILSQPSEAVAVSTLQFQVKNAQPNTYVLRLRVDGAESIPVDFATRPAKFASNQTVEIKKNSE